MQPQPQLITGQVTTCRRDSTGRLDALGGEGWLIEPELVAADIIACAPDHGPYFVTTPTGEPHWLTVCQAKGGQHFTLSTDHGDWPLAGLPQSPG